MKKRGSGPHDNDRALLEELLAKVVPLADHGRVIHPRPKTEPIPVQRLRDERAALAESLSDPITWDVETETGEELLYLRGGLSRTILRKLRRGHWVIQEELDLHGLTSVEARALLGEFLNACIRSGARCVRIVHGKGLRSKNREPVLKTKVAKWLIQRDEVLAFCQARQADGGGGAVVVLLKSARR
jgi:DNA-nicking Smr family endonuclease